MSARFFYSLHYWLWLFLKVWCLLKKLITWVISSCQSFFFRFWYHDTLCDWFLSWFGDGDVFHRNFSHDLTTAMSFAGISLMIWWQRCLLQSFLSQIWQWYLSQDFFSHAFHQDIILDADLWKTCSLCKSLGICTIRFAEFCTSGYLRSIDIWKYLLIQIFRILYLQISEDIYWHISMQHRYLEICIYINLQKFLSAGIQKYLKIYIDIYF